MQPRVVHVVLRAAQPAMVSRANAEQQSARLLQAHGPPCMARRRWRCLRGRCRHNRATVRAVLGKTGTENDVNWVGLVVPTYTLAALHHAALGDADLHLPSLLPRLAVWPTS